MSRKNVVNPRPRRLRYKLAIFGLRISSKQRLRYRDQCLGKPIKAINKTQFHGCYSLSPFKTTLLLKLSQELVFMHRIHMPNWPVVKEKHIKIEPRIIYVLLFMYSLDFVLDYLGKPVPER